MCYLEMLNVYSLQKETFWYSKECPVIVSNTSEKEVDVFLKNIITSSMPDDDENFDDETPDYTGLTGWVEGENDY